ncbi:hypothetical protein AWM68_12240 [Fictibacillus phosphorivorans]|uniref:Uncharacterized protein n=1 Tax=Fictibacillus phosphorivorans TaxID=1221500 RepID=A0A168CQL5_9BACL|nr:hypothetical protein AWM68_12240 [Fictibacillus phosphorivorans]
MNWIKRELGVLPSFFLFEKYINEVDHGKNSCNHGIFVVNHGKKLGNHGKIALNHVKVKSDLFRSA